MEMRLKFLATGNAPHGYAFAGDTITVAVEPVTEQFDLSALEHGGAFEGITMDTLPLAPAHVLRHAERDKFGELWVTLCQKAGSGHWVESNWMDAADYVPGELYIRRVG